MVKPYEKKPTRPKCKFYGQALWREQHDIDVTFMVKICEKNNTI